MIHLSTVSEDKNKDLQQTVKMKLDKAEVSCRRYLKSQRSSKESGDDGVG